MSARIYIFTRFCGRNPAGLPISLESYLFFSLIDGRNQNVSKTVSRNMCVFRIFVELKLLRLSCTHTHVRLRT